jgi:hypothetical protein
VSNLKDKFEFRDYNGNNLAFALSSHLYPEHVVKSKSQFVYLVDYLKKPIIEKGVIVDDGLAIETILIENEYYSQSYVEDYKNFHVLTHYDYSKKSKRVHFFQNVKPTVADEIEIFTNYQHPDISPFWDSYVGYIVVRPLPSGLIGATILKHYPEDGIQDHKRVFPTQMTYNMNIFGVKRSISSLIYQEQDALAGACATSSLWCTFYKLNDLFKTPILSPSAITIAAGRSIDHVDRLMPNTGLDLVQMRNAINSIGMEAEIKNSDEIKNNRWVRGMAYSYLKFGIPVILGIEFNKQKSVNGFGYELLKQNHSNSIYHAITLSGYQDLNNVDLSKYFNRVLNLLRKFTERQWKSQSPVQIDLSLSEIFISESEVNIKGELISKFYAHDDQVGPFSRLTFSTQQKIVTSWWNKKNFFDVHKKEVGHFHSLIIPTPSEFKIHYVNVREQISILNLLLTRYLSYPLDIYWDIYLDQSNNYKSRKISNDRDSSLPKDYFLFESLPKYIWVAEVHYYNIHLLDYILDPTEINCNSSGMYFRYYRVLEFSKDYEYVKKSKEVFAAVHIAKILESPVRKERKYLSSLLSTFNLLAKYLERGSG